MLQNNVHIIYCNFNRHVGQSRWYCGNRDSHSWHVICIHLSKNLWSVPFSGKGIKCTALAVSSFAFGVPTVTYRLALATDKVATIEIEFKDVFQLRNVCPLYHKNKRSLITPLWVRDIRRKYRIVGWNVDAENKNCTHVINDNPFRYSSYRLRYGLTRSMTLGTFVGIFGHRAKIVLIAEVLDDNRTFIKHIPIVNKTLL